MILITLNPQEPGYVELLQYLKTRGIKYEVKVPKPTGINDATT